VICEESNYQEEMRERGARYQRGNHMFSRLFCVIKDIFLKKLQKIKIYGVLNKKKGCK